MVYLAFNYKHNTPTEFYVNRFSTESLVIGDCTGHQSTSHQFTSHSLSTNELL